MVMDLLVCDGPEQSWVSILQLPQVLQGFLTIGRESEVCISHNTEVSNARVKHKERDTSSQCPLADTVSRLDTKTG